MPNYVYECPECGEFELEQGINDPKLTKCLCGEPVRRLIVNVMPLKDALPSHMTAKGSDAHDRQAAYLRSDKWRQKRQEIDAKGGTVKLGSDVD